jgi:urease accessory protein
MGRTLLSLFQITDSFFPSGAFAHSWGLETYVAEGLIRDVEDLYRFLKAYITCMVGRCDALVVRLAFEGAEARDVTSLFRLDRLVHSMKLAKELREGSIQTGRQLFRLMSELQGSAVLEEFSSGLRTGRALGHHPVVFGLICHVIGAEGRDSVFAYFYTTLSSLVSAGVRLIPLGHTDGQRVIERLKPLLIEVTEEVFRLKEEDLSCFSPGIEIRAMRHETLYTRLFRS